MSANMMHYKGYPARVEYSQEDGCLVGRVLGIRDIIDFEGESVAEAERDFRAAIDFYLESCEKRGKTPNKPEHEDIPLAIPADVYSQISLAAEGSGRTVGEMVVRALRAAYPEKKTRAKARSAKKGKKKPELVG